MKHYPPQIIFLQRIFEPLMQTTRKQCVDLMQGGLNIFTIPPSGIFFSHPSIFFFNQANTYSSFYRIVCYKYYSTVSFSTFLRHFCKQNHSLVPLIYMSRSLKFMNCCKFVQTKHGQPSPCKRETCNPSQKL